MLHNPQDLLAKCVGLESINFARILIYSFSKGHRASFSISMPGTRAGLLSTPDILPAAKLIKKVMALSYTLLSGAQRVR
jgi:hypothetical protein